MDSSLRFRHPEAKTTLANEPLTLTARCSNTKYHGCSSSPTTFTTPATPTSYTDSPTFMGLPPEIHIMISRNLIYPDALSLKHTSRYFYYMVDTGVGLKVDWLMQRRKLHLDCPANGGCDLGSDLRFCRGSVRLLMQRRREHMECESRPGLGCLVYGTAQCTHRKTLAERWKRWMRKRLTLEVWWLAILLAVVISLFLTTVWAGGRF